MNFKNISTGCALIILIASSGMVQSLEAAFPRCQYPCRSYVESSGSAWNRNNAMTATTGPWDGIWYSSTPFYVRTACTCPCEQVPYGVPADVASMEGYVEDAMRQLESIEFRMSTDANRQRLLQQQRDIVTSLGSQFDVEYRNYVATVQRDQIGARGLEGRLRNLFQGFQFEYEKFLNLLRN